MFLRQKKWFSDPPHSAGHTFPLAPHHPRHPAEPGDTSSPQLSLFVLLAKPKSKSLQNISKQSRGSAKASNSAARCWPKPYFCLGSAPPLFCVAFIAIDQSRKETHFTGIWCIKTAMACRKPVRAQLDTSMKPTNLLEGRHHPHKICIQF